MPISVCKPKELEKIILNTIGKQDDIVDAVLEYLGLDKDDLSIFALHISDVNNISGTNIFTICLRSMAWKCYRFRSL